MKYCLIAVAALVGTLAAATTLLAAKEEGTWVKLGTRTVDFKGDHDVIEVGKSEGKFTHVRFNVEEGDLLMEKLKITFGNGDTFEPETKMEFKEGTRSHSIELPPKVAGRVITKVDFVYRSEHRREKAVIVLYGREK